MLLAVQQSRRRSKIGGGFAVTGGVPIMRKGLRREIRGVPPLKILRNDTNFTRDLSTRCSRNLPAALDRG
jgi:hypothetical protein